MLPLRSLLDGSTSMHGLLAGMKPEEVENSVAVTRSKGPRSKANSRIVDYKRTGPFYTQTGSRVIAGQEMPILRTHYVHRFLHATKGWREYHGGKLYHLPSSAARPQGRQLFKRSTWRPNRIECLAGNVPRLNTVQQEPELGIDYAAGKPVEMSRYRNRRGRWRLGFKIVEGAAA